MLYQVFVYVCAGGIICAGIFVGRILINMCRKDKIKWPIGTYFWVWIAALVLSVMPWVFGNRPKNNKIQISYSEYYAYCVKNVGHKENALIKKMTGADFCDCIANQMASQDYVNEYTLKAAGEAATIVCENKIDKILSAKGL